MTDLSRLSDHELRRLATASGERRQAGSVRTMSDEELQNIAGIDRGTAFLRGLGDSLSFSLGDEAMGLGAGAGALLSGGDARAAYDRQVAQSRRNLDQANEQHPWSTGAGTFAGYLAPGFALGKVGRVGLNTVGRIGSATGIGAGIGALSGFGSGETMDERLQGAGMGAALGGALGGGTQAILGEAAPALVNQGRRWLSGVTGMPRNTGRMGIAETAREDLMSTARQNINLGVRDEADLAARMQEAARTDPTLTVAEVLGQSGQGRLAALARAPGQTGQRTEDYFVARARDQADEVTGAVLGRAPASGDALEQELQQAWRTRGPELYEPVLRQQLGNESLAAAQALRDSPLFQHRAVQAAWERSGAMIADDVALGRIARGAENSLAHRLHYTKVALDDMIADPTRLEPGIRNMNNASIQAAREQLLGRIERIIPGYNAARRQMADIGAARRAVEQGRQAFTRQSFATPEALQRHIAALPEAERPFFVAGVEDALSNMIRGAGRDGSRNVASTLLSDATQARMRAIYGREAEGMISRLRQISEKFTFGQRVRPSQGSITSNVMIQNLAGAGIGAGTGAANAQDDPIMGALTGGALGFGFSAVGRQMMRRAFLQQIEQGAQRQRDLLGRIYLTPAGAFQRESRGLLSRAQREAQRRAARTRLQRTRGAYISGVGAMGVYDAKENR